MSALDKFYDFTLNLPDAKLTSKAMSLCNIDRNVFNIYLTLQEGKNNPILNADLGNYTVTMIVVKPKTKEYVEKVGVVDGSNDRLLFELGETFNDQIGSYKGEIKVQNGDEVITSSSFAYTVTQSLISGLNAEIEANPDVEILRKLINEVKAAVGMTPEDPDSLLTDYQTKVDNTLTTTEKEIPKAINEVNSQIKEITNKVGDETKGLVKDVNDLKNNSIGILTSPNGDQFILKVNDDGSLYTEKQTDYIPESDLPSDFPKYTITGQSSLTNDFLITPHNDSTTSSYIFIMDYKGRVKKYKKINKFAYSFRKYTNSQGQIRYTYHECINHLFPTFAMNGGYDNNELVIMDENFEEIKRVRCKASGTVEENYPLENHDYIFIDDNHYIVTSYHNNTVTNVPSIASCSVVNCVIQEIKNDTVIFHWESIDHVELYSASHTNNNFAGFTSTTYNDYAHLNSVQIDSRDGNLLCSFRHIGLMKIHRTTGEIIWIMGRGNIDASKKLNGFTSTQCGHLQHDARYNYDDSITIFDNSGCATDNTRICRYWINEETKTLTDFKEYKLPIAKTAFMGYAKLIDDQNEIFDVAGYGAKGSTLAFNEYNFKTNTEQMKFKFNDNSDTYRIFRDITDDEVIKNITIPCTKLTLDKENINLSISQVDSSTINLANNATYTGDTDFVSNEIVVNKGIYNVKNTGEGSFTWLGIYLNNIMFQADATTKLYEFPILNDNTTIKIKGYKTSSDIVVTNENFGLFKTKNANNIVVSTPFTRLKDSAINDSNVGTHETSNIVTLDSTKSYILRAKDSNYMGDGCLCIKTNLGNYNWKNLYEYAESLPIIRNAISVQVSCAISYGLSNIELIEFSEEDSAELVYGTASLTATLTPVSATNQNVNWVSSDTSKVSIESEGLNATITAVSEGTSIITCTSQDTTNGTISDSCTVIVSNS